MDELLSSGVEFVGPFESYAVVVDGWRVPLLEASMEPGGQVRLVLDERFSLSLPIGEAERILPFVAQVVAVSLGFQAHPQGEEQLMPRPAISPTRLAELAFDRLDQPSGTG